MGSQVTLVYKVTPTGVLSADLVPLIAPPLPTAAPAGVGPAVPVDFLRAFGLRVTSDVTVGGATITRTIVLAFNPSAGATGTLTIDSDGKLIAVPVTAPGLDYVQPPLVVVNMPAEFFRVPPRPLNTFPNPPPILSPIAPQIRAVLGVFAIEMLAGGAAYVAPTATFIGGLPPAGTLGPGKTGCVRQINVKEKGFGYPVGTICSIEGTCTIQAKATPVLDAFGRIVRIDVTDMGAGYTTPPLVALHPPGLLGAPVNRACKAFAILAEGTPARAGAITVVGNAITAIAIASNGDNYIEPPFVLIQDAAGSGAVARARMGVTRFPIVSPGQGTPRGTTMTTFPVFQKFFPSLTGGDDPNQRPPFVQLMQDAIAQSAMSPCLSDPPVVA